MISRIIGLGVMLSITVFGTDGIIADDSTPVDSALLPVANFRLRTVDGGEVTLADESAQGITVVCFLGAECPLARLYAPQLELLHQRYASQGVRFIGVGSNRQDTPDELQAYGRALGISFPLAKDPGNKVADDFGAQRTPEVFVLDAARKIRYRGRVDDRFQPGLVRNEPSRADLKWALDELLAGKAVSVAKTTASGCYIGRVKTSAVDSSLSYHEQVVPVLERHCVECHQAGEIGPFALTDYDEIVGWGDAMLESINAGRMPPWHANPDVGSFVNARTMPETDKQLLRDWIAAGMPRGDVPTSVATATAKPNAPAEPSMDLVLPMRNRPFVVPAEGTVEYQYFVVDPQFTEDRWVSSAIVIPGNRAVVHHALIFVRPPDGTEVNGVGWLTAYVPGQRFFQLPPGRARHIPAGSKLVFQMHYTPNGAEQTDLTRVGMTFVPAAEVTHEVFSVVAINQSFEIPPETANYPVQARVRRLPKRGELLGMAPHMYLRGQSFQVTVRKGGKEQMLLDVPRYDFNWQHAYELSTPLDLADVESLEITARFDNSRNNPVNPDPTQTVTWGDQTWEEMAIAFFEIAVPREPSPDEPRPSNTTPQRDVTADVEAFVKRFFEQHDRDRDGTIEHEETSLVFRNYGFRGVDSNNDSRITREEVEAAAKRHFSRK